MKKCTLLVSITLVTGLFSSDKLLSQDISSYEAFNETFERPIGIEYSHDESPYIYIIEQRGVVKRLNIDQPLQSSEIWFDISDKIQASGEKGLLGLAFHPDYPINETFYVNYNFVNSSDELFTRISRFYAPGGVADPGSEEILLSFEQPGNNHNGGQLVFGPDDYLYISLGDGGGPQNRENSQDLTDFFGDILRIDVNTESGYKIPADNPFVDDPEALDEIYSFGFRNPWRMSFDSQTGNLLVADVGEVNRESIYIAEKGRNYGWPVVEGTFCFESENCDKNDIEIPFYEYIYDQEDTGRSITGGYVYRGQNNPSLKGKYIYGDYISGRIWALEIDQESFTPVSNTLLLETGLRIPSFGVDSRGEIYTIGWGRDAKIYRFAPELTITTATLKSVDGSNAVQLSWETNRDSGIDSFEIYKGPSVSDMSLLTTVSGTDLGYIDPDPLDGSTFYTVRAIETDGDAGEMSDPVSYYRASSTIPENWQLMSVPYETAGQTIDNTIAYSFDGSYAVADALEPGNGYWIRSTSDGGSVYQGEGLGIQTSTLQLKQGWNLVGGLVGELPNNLLADGGGILNSTPMYGFNGSSYEESDRFVPGQGYWIYADDDGDITLDLESLLAVDPLSNVIANDAYSKRTGVNDLDMFEFKAGGQSAEFHVSPQPLDPERRNQFRIPPVAPNASIDVRTDDGFRLAENNRFEPQVTANEFPLTIVFSRAGNVEAGARFGLEVTYELRVWSGGLDESVNLREGESHITYQEFDRLEFQRVEEESEIVRQTELLPSYPNPFNPVTNITYRLAEQQNVTLSIFDAAGRRIATLVDREQEAGRYSLPFDASGLASGIYFVRFSAGDVLSTQKLTLIK